VLGELLGPVLKQDGTPSKNSVLPGHPEPEKGFEPLTCALRGQVRVSLSVAPRRK
jgi:hypothetical protein